MSDVDPRRQRRATLREIVEASAHYEQISYALADDDDGHAWCTFASSATELAGRPQSFIAQAFWAARWRNQGFPRVVIGPRRSSSLMATGVAAEQMELVRPPWKAFLIELTESPVTTLAGDIRSSIDRIAVQYATHHHGAPAWWMIAESQAGPSLHRFAVLPSQWLQDKLVHEGPVDDFSALEMQDEDLRTLTLLSRLVAGLCLSLSEPEQREAAARRAKGKSYRARRRGPPVVRDYVLGDDVRIDARDAIGEFITRGGRAPKVQSLVRGHWKMQPHGKERSLRKWLHIEPYWRGPEDAPVLMRRHKLVDGKVAS